MEKKINPFVYWVPRALSIVFILFMVLMSMDVFESSYGFWQTAVALFMHNIPAIILIIVLIISWKYEIVGGIVFNLAGLFYVIMLIVSRNVAWYLALSWSLTVAGPAFLIGILFLTNWFKKKQNTRAA